MDVKLKPLEALTISWWMMCWSLDFVAASSTQQEDMYIMYGPRNWDFLYIMKISLFRSEKKKKKETEICCWMIETWTPEYTNIVLLFFDTAASES